MTREEFDKKIAMGLNEKKINKHFAISFLMIRAIEDLNNELIDYLSEFNMNTMDIKHQLKGIDGRLKKLANSIIPTYSKTKENKKHFFEDYDEFKNIIERFRDGE